MILSEVVLKITRTKLDDGQSLVLLFCLNRETTLLAIMTMLITFIRYSFEILSKLCGQICGERHST